VPARPLKTTSKSAGRDACSSMKAALSSDRLEIELTAPLDDEEQPARHGSALAAARRRALSSLANVALLQQQASMRQRGLIRDGAQG